VETKAGVDERYMAKEREIMDSSLNKKRKRENVVRARETGWDVAYEDEISVGGGTDDDLDRTKETDRLDAVQGAIVIMPR
jgi:hypothetical protein